MMKMIICILQDLDLEDVSKALNDEGYRATMFPSTGAFFRRGNATLMIGVEEEKVKPVIELIKDNVSDPDEPNLRRATVFVINVEQFIQV